ncbi:cobaltochelatase subunit CobN [Luteimonas sp. SJ-92]|uniref:Cobaltochelatase subunit CobN n=1 Tax=Luteimonas salinisoli TaxID=2752307 RepID=A0A853J7V1_9GAMM|nr:cobaltochelatase subunit CobN [Luteimonas salinisoli]NZA24955.1 cobaltochelatase subunit CobN [Luteimonas salinisoli]
MRWLLLVVVLACSGPARAAEPLRVTVVTTDFTLPGKTLKIDRWGRTQGVRFEYLSVDRPPPGEPRDWLAASGLVIVDTPVASHAERVRALIAPALDELGTPWIAIGGGPLGFDGIEPAQARQVAGYYQQGGETNFRRMLDWLGRWHRDEALASVPPPVPMPATGYYHPEAAEPFSSLDDYLGWQRQRGHADGARVALVISSHALSSMQLRDVDALIAASEARGLVPVTLWFERNDPDGLIDGLRDTDIAALVNLTHLGNGERRLRDFTALDVPALIASTARGSTVESWRGEASGMSAAAMATLLAVPESWGMSDPVVLAAVEDGEPVPIPEQVELLADKLASLARLRATAAADKRLALMFWNYPHGERNLSASQLNLPRSVADVTAALAAAEYPVDASTEAQVIEAGQAMLAGWYRPETLPGLVERDLAATLPLAAYERWLRTLPARQREALLETWGDPDDSRAVITVDGVRAFAIPRWRLGGLAVLPQPPRAGEYGTATHDGAVPPAHAYLATYLWLRQQHDPHALIHFGTHGTQEWLPGKDRGLWAFDWPNLVVGDLPVFYPYIQDNIGEAVQAKRRGRAVLVSHQTPAFAPAGLYDELRDLHHLVHEYQMTEPGPVREAAMRRLRDAAIARNLHADIGWQEAAIDADFEQFFVALHDHLHQLARSAIPLGLHVFGTPAAPEHRLSTVMQQLGDDYYAALGLDPQEVFAEDFARLQESEPYRFLRRYLRDGEPPQRIGDPALREQVERAIASDRRLAQTGEIKALLAGLRGGFVRPGEGGDPVRNPEVPSGRNLYPFDPDRIPTRAAWQAGGEAFEQLLAAHRQTHDGAAPDKLAFVMWSVETVRHLGVVEAQVLHAAGLRPVWSAGGDVERIEIVPQAELGRPRVDVVVQVTGSYRDQFDGFMHKLDAALQQLARLEEPGNAIAANSRRIAAALVARGVDAARASEFSRLRMFGNAPGDYGTDLADQVMDSTGWDDEAPLAAQFLARMQYGYGGGDWGASGGGDANLLADHLAGTDGVVLPRSSNVYGVLNTDHVFEYMGGLSMAMREVDGSTPALYVSDLRTATARTTTAAEFLSAELRSRYLNPQWIGAMQQEGYAGTLQVLDVANNLFGWQATAPGTVRADQWQALHETYVRDERELGIDAWFEQHNPTAQAQLIERMMEAVRKGYWQADERTRRELAQRWQALTAELGADAGARITREFIEQVAGGFGLDPGMPRPAAAQPPTRAEALAPDANPEPPTADPADPAEPATVRGRVMQEVVRAASAEPPWQPWLGGLLLLACAGLGGWRQARLPRLSRSSP